MGVERNEEVDEAAKEAPKRPDAQRYSERFSSLCHVGGTVTARKWKGAKHWFRAENGRGPSLQRALYEVALESLRLDIKAMKMAVLVSRRYFQLKPRHAVTGTYLDHIWKTEYDYY